MTPKGLKDCEMFFLYTGPTRSTSILFLIQFRGPPPLGWGAFVAQLTITRGA